MRNKLKILRLILFFLFDDFSAILVLTGKFSICDTTFAPNKSDNIRQLFVSAFFDARDNITSYFFLYCKKQQINHSS